MGNMDFVLLQLLKKAFYIFDAHVVSFKNLQLFVHKCFH
jgi:hypothetical protein